MFSPQRWMSYEIFPNLENHIIKICCHRQKNTTKNISLATVRTSLQHWVKRCSSFSHCWIVILRLVAPFFPWSICVTVVLCLLIYSLISRRGHFASVVLVMFKVFVIISDAHVRFNRNLKSFQQKAVLVPHGKTWGRGLCFERHILRGLF